MRFIKNILILVVLISSGAALALDYKDYEPLDKIIAIVEKDLINEKEMEEAFFLMNDSILGVNALDRPNKAEIRKTVLDQLIEKKIIGQYAEQNQLIIDSEQIDNALKNIAANKSISLKQLKESAQKKGSLDSLYEEVRFQ